MELDERDVRIIVCLALFLLAWMVDAWVGWRDRQKDRERITGLEVRTKALELELLDREPVLGPRAASDDEGDEDGRNWQAGYFGEDTL